MQVSPMPCEPPVESIRFGEEKDETVAQRMRGLFQEDQVSRQSEPIDWDTLNAEDLKRRVEVMRYLQQAEINDPESLYHAAFIFQHGDCPDHYQLANQLAERAMNSGYKRACWIYAASLDRYLRSIGEPQKFGTQFIVIDGQWALQPHNPATTDEERKKYNVPLLAQQLKYAEDINRKNGQL